MSVGKITIDFETRSEAPISIGPWLYSRHKSTEVMCLAYKINNQNTKLWHPGYKSIGIIESDWPEDLFRAISEGYIVEAHNRFFEFCIWTNICVKKMGWPDIKEEQWRCSAAKAAFYCLPRSLDGVAQALRLPVQKDMEGNRIMRQVASPKPLTKTQIKNILKQDPLADVTSPRWLEDVDKFQKLWDYCVSDVEVEHLVSEALPDLPEVELKIWQMDQRMNLRGVYCDVDMASKALAMKNSEIDAINAELVDLTSGELTKITERSKALEYINRHGVDLPNTQGPVLEKYLKLPMRSDIKYIIRLIRDGNRSSIAKYKKMIERSDPEDNRMRDLMMYHGASTGRWSGKGVQPHNFPRGNIKQMELACSLIKDYDREAILSLFGNVTEHLSFALRGALCAPKDKDLIVADYAAIEARVVFWLAQDNNALDVFRRHEDIYCDMATGIYGYTVTKKYHPDERQFGKQSILGLGFEMGFVTFLLTCKKYDIHFTEEMCRKIVGHAWESIEYKIKKYFEADPKRKNRLLESEYDLTLENCWHELVLMQYTVGKYRTRYPEVTQMWRDQETAAIQAIRCPGIKVESSRGRNYWIVENNFLKCYLPSGRALHYYEPKLIRKRTPFKNPDGSPVIKSCVTFSGPDSKTGKLVRQETYGGKLVENITQAVARDLMAQAMLRADEGSKYKVILSVHDELICEVESGKGNVREFESLMSEIPGWAKGCPVDAEGWIGKRYRK